MLIIEGPDSSLWVAFGWPHEIDVSVLRDDALPSKLLDNYWIRCTGQLSHFLRREVVERMRCYQQRQIFDVKMFCSEPAMFHECSGDHC